MGLQRIIPLIAFTINYQCKFLMACSHLWNDKTCQLSLNPLVYRRWKLCSGIISCYFFFLLRGFHKYFDGSDYSNSDFAYHALYLLSFFLALCDKLNCFRLRTMYAGTFNGFVKYFFYFIGNSFNAKIYKSTKCSELDNLICIYIFFRKLCW